MQEQTHFEVTSDNDKIKEKLSNESQLCFVLNPKLTKNQLWTLCGEGYLVDVNYDNKAMYGVICGFYRNGELHPRETEKMLDRTTRSKVLDELVTEPSLCYLLHKSLDEKTIALLSNAYNVITAYLINILVACIYMQESQNLKTIQHNIPNELLTVESLLTN